MSNKETHTIGPRARIVSELIPDTDPSNPRDDDNLATLWCWHRRYHLGDREDRPRDPVNEEELAEHLATQGDSPVVILPLYLYDHSGITMSTTPFSCTWDSGQVGFAFVTEKVALANFPELKGEALRQRLLDVIRAEVKEFDSFISGDCWGVRTTVEHLDQNGRVEDVTEVECVWGYIGFDYASQSAREQLVSVLKYEKAEWFKSLVGDTDLQPLIDKLTPKAAVPQGAAETQAWGADQPTH